MRYLLATLSLLVLTLPVAAGQSPKKACLNTEVRVPFSQIKEAEVWRLNAEKKVKNCTEYLDGLKERKRPRLKESVTIMEALLQRAKGYTILGQKQEALADIQRMWDVAKPLKIRHKLSPTHGVGDLLEALGAMNSDDPAAATAALAAANPYFEPYHQIAASYALDQKDYIAAAHFSTLSDKLNEDAVAAQFKGYLLEMQGHTEKALEHYAHSYPSLDSLIRTAHLQLTMDNLEASKAAFKEAQALGTTPKTVGGDAMAQILSGFTARDDRGRNLTPINKKRMEILEKIYEIEAKDPADVYKSLMQMGGSFGHFELINGLQYVATKMETQPLEVSKLDARPKVIESLDSSKIRNSALNHLTSHISSLKTPIRVRPTYSRSIPLLTSGFSYDTLEDGSIQVTYDGLKGSKSNLAEMALLGVAELALKKGKRFFRIRDLDNYNKVRTMNGIPTGTTVGSRVKFVIEYTDDQVYPEKDFDALKVKEVLEPKYTS